MTFETEQFAQVDEEAAERNVILCVETIFAAKANYWCQTLEGLAKQIQQVNLHSLRATIDFSHATIRMDQIGGDLMSGLRKLAPFTQHLHLHDSFGINRSFPAYNYFDQRMFGIGDLHLPMGWGNLNWEEFTTLPFAAGTITNLETPELAAGAQITSVAAAKLFQKNANK